MSCDPVCSIKLSRNSEKMRFPYSNVKDQRMNLFLPLDFGCVNVKPGRVIGLCPHRRSSLKMGCHPEEKRTEEMAENWS